MLEHVGTKMSCKVAADSAVAGFRSETHANHETIPGVILLIATGRMMHRETIATDGKSPRAKASLEQARHHNLRTDAGRAVCKGRRVIVEPLYALSNERRGFPAAAPGCADWRGCVPNGS